MINEQLLKQQLSHVLKKVPKFSGTLQPERKFDLYKIIQKTIFVLSPSLLVLAQENACLDHESFVLECFLSILKPLQPFKKEIHDLYTACGEDFLVNAKIFLNLCFFHQMLWENRTLHAPFEAVIMGTVMTQVLRKCLPVWLVDGTRGWKKTLDHMTQEFRLLSRLLPFCLK